MMNHSTIAMDGIYSLAKKQNHEFNYRKQQADYAGHRNRVSVCGCSNEDSAATWSRYARDGVPRLL